MGIWNVPSLEQYTRHDDIRPHKAEEVLCNNLKTTAPGLVTTCLLHGERLVTKVLGGGFFKKSSK